MVKKIARIPFYRPDAVCDLDWCEKDETKLLKEQGVTILTRKEGNKHRFDKFFDSVCCYQEDYFRAECACIPRFRSGLINIPIPYDVSSHGEFMIDNRTIEKIIEDHVAANFTEPIYLFSGEPNNAVCLKMDMFSYKILGILEWGGRMNGAFVLFDSKLDQCFNFHFDLCVTLYTRDVSLADKTLYGKPDNFWISYFNENFDGYNDYHRRFVNADYGSRISGLKV